MRGKMIRRFTTVATVSKVLCLAHSIAAIMLTLGVDSIEIPALWAYLALMVYCAAAALCFGALAYEMAYRADTLRGDHRWE